MNDNTDYANLNWRLVNVANNIDNIVYYMNLFNNNCAQALVLNNGTDYKNTIINNKYALEKQRSKIRNEILTEVRSKM